MPGSIQSRLLRHEETPPPAVWDKISKQLDDEFSVADTQLSSKLENAEIAPPPLSWSTIAAGLDSDEHSTEKRTAKVIPILYKRLAVAVMISAFLAVGAMYFFTNGTSENGLVTREDNLMAKRRPGSNVPSTALSLPDIQRDTKSQKFLIAALPKSRRTISFAAPSNLAEEEYSEAPNAPQMEQFNTAELQTENSQQSINVSAPPLRDGSGNIIMDLQLISQPDRDYITVTGPNGNQTRISNKFLSCLSYINGNYSGSDMDADAEACKAKFEEWRNKLLSEAAFIPTATNFFDIFELKDIIQD